MANVGGALPPPYEGVSQVDPAVRLAGACEAMEDCIALLPQGVSPRPPFDLYEVNLVNSLGAPIVADPYAAWFNVDRADEALDLALLINREGAAVVPHLFFTSTGDPCPLTVSADAQTYLSTFGTDTKPCRDFRAVTVEDTTFVVNRRVTVANGVTNAPTRPFEGMILCKTGGYARTTVVTITSTAIPGSYAASFKTNNGGNILDAEATGTARLARALYDGTDPSPAHDVPNPNPLNALAAHGFTVVLDGSIIYLSHATVDFQIDITDDAGGTAVTAVKGQVQRFSDLPAIAHAGFTVRIAQESAGANNDYYVEFVPASSSTVGVWKEVIAPGAPLGVNPKTLPLRLYLIAGNWNLAVAPWTGRTTGTAQLSVDPAFIGEQIRDINWWRGRLGLVSTAAYSLSASNNPFQFYTTTLAAALASDPIQFLPPGEGKKRFDQCVTFEKAVVVLGNKSQAIVTAGATVAPDTAGIEPLSDTPFFDQVPVQGAASKVYFSPPRTNFIAVYELATDRVSGKQVPNDVSGAIPRYIPDTVDRATTLSTEFLTVYGASGDSTLWVHVFRHDDQGQRVQNAWFRWHLPPQHTVAGIFFKGHILNCMMVNNDTYFTWAQMDLSPDIVDAGGTMLTHADLRYTEAFVTPIYDALSDTTGFALMLPSIAGLNACVRGAAGFTSPSGGAYPEGYLLEVVDLVPGFLTVRGDWTGAPLWFGYTYRATFTPSTFYHRGGDGNVINRGRTTVKHLDIQASGGSFMQVRVAIAGRSEKTPFAAIVGGDVPSSTESAKRKVVSVPIGGRNTDTQVRIESDLFRGFKIVGLEWSGSFSPKFTRDT